nr:U6 small nuclear RNA (adenine-(43)-N(6))-methyltransferase [Tanacetum cinerariifolium]
MIDQDTNDDESYTDIRRNTEQTCDENKSYHVGVVKPDETFDFCMCNPPFFESMKESKLNPNTSQRWANCIYPLLGVSLLGWSFVGTDVALEWAERNVKNNPQIYELIEIQKVDYEK